MIGFRIYPTQAQHLVRNAGAHWQGTVYANLETYLLLHPDRVIWKETARALEGVGVGVVPALRLGPPKPGSWYDAGHWAALVDDLRWLAALRRDRRLCFDAERYTGDQQEPMRAVPGKIPDREADLRAAMGGFMNAVGSLGIEPLVHPAHPDHLIPRLLVEAAGGGVYQTERSFGLVERFHRNDRAYLEHTVSVYREAERLRRNTPGAGVQFGFFDTYLRRQGAPLREAFPEGWVFLHDRSDEAALGTRAWLHGSADLPDHEWDFSGYSWQRDIHQGIMLMPMIPEVIRPGATVREGRLRLEGTQYLALNSHTLPDVYALTLRGVGQVDGVVASVWIDGGHRAWMLTVQGDTYVLTAQPARGNAVTLTVPYTEDVTLHIAPRQISLAGRQRRLRAPLQWPQGTFRIGGAGRGTVWHSWDGGSLAGLTLKTPGALKPY